LRHERGNCSRKRPVTDIGDECKAAGLSTTTVF
jgi:hypothetical protein